jgi:8-oxo-dGTP pyrophosphatase MutT (NUDIX family)
VERVNRRSARVVLVDDQGRVLLFRVVDPQTDAIPVWLTPGGGIEAGEDLATAACRELQEETGLVISVDELGPAVAVTRGEWVFRGQPLYSEDWFFAARVPSFEPDFAGWTELEHELHADCRWWTGDELDAADELIIPAGLAHLVRDIHRGLKWADPIVLPWVAG